MQIPSFLILKLCLFASYPTSSREKQNLVNMQVRIFIEDCVFFFPKTKVIKVVQTT